MSDSEEVTLSSTTVVFGSILLILLGMTLGGWMYQFAFNPTATTFDDKVEFDFTGDTFTVEPNKTHSPNQTCFRNYFDRSFDVKNNTDGSVTVMKTWDNGKWAFFGDRLQHCVQPR